MKFGAVLLDEAEGAILAHAVRIDGVALKKGDVLTPERRRMLAEAGLTSVIAARLEAGDVDENEAARTLAKRLAGEHVRREAAFTGRVNLFAEAAGLAVVDAEAIDRINAIDEAVTVATLPNYRVVAKGDMVATVKIIPFAAPGKVVDAAIAALGNLTAVSVAPFRPLRIGVISNSPAGPQAKRRRQDPESARDAPRPDRRAHRRRGDGAPRGRRARRGP